MQKLKKDGWIRLGADLLMVNFALFVGLILSYPMQMAARSSSRLPGMVEFLSDYWISFPVITLISLPIYHAFGFYTRSRGYRSRYKILIVLQAVAISYLAFGFLGFIASEWLVMPKISVFIAAVITAVMLAAARVWSAVWHTFKQEESGVKGTHFVLSDKPRNVVVIGGAGYIGSALLPKLLDRGYRVRLVDQFMYGEEPIKEILGHKNLEIVKADFRQIDKVVEAMYGMDAVIHLGAIVGDPACALDEEFTIEVNLMATRMIAECAKGFGISRFIFASTCSVYGASDHLLNERSSLNPVSLYARSKIACERVLQSMTTDTFRPTILRFGTVYGLSGRTRFDLVINLLTAKAIVDGKITVFGEDQWRPFVHVDDAALAVATALDASQEAVGGEIFNVGSDEGNMTLGQAGRMIHQLVPSAEYLPSGTDGDRRNYRVDFAKIKQRTDYQAKWTVEMGIKQVIESFNSGSVTDYTSAQYSNVKFLTEEANQGLLKKDGVWLRSLIEDHRSAPDIQQKVTSK